MKIHTICLMKVFIDNKICISLPAFIISDVSPATYYKIYMRNFNIYKIFIYNNNYAF